MDSLTTVSPINSCSEYGCQTGYEDWMNCQCYAQCLHWNDCCDDFVDTCEGMAGIERAERLALTDVSAFSVFYSIILFILLLMIFVWALFVLMTYCKKHANRSSLPSKKMIILTDNKLLIILSFTSMFSYLLSIFCYLISNASLGIHYDRNNDTYGNSQIVSIIFWFIGHTLFYEIFIIKLYYFKRDTSYNVNIKLQITSFIYLTSLWFISTVVMIIWIEEFHEHYHYGMINDEKIMATMVISFTIHIWFCISVILLFLISLKNLVTNKSSMRLIRGSRSTSNYNDGGLTKQEMENKIIEYLTRLTVLLTCALSVTIFCILMWIILMSSSDPPYSLIRFCWWLFAFNILTSFICVWLNLNFETSFLEIYKKLCLIPHSFCKFYCIRASLGNNNNSKKSKKIRDYDDDDDDDDELDDDTQGVLHGNNQINDGYNDNDDNDNTAYNNQINDNPYDNNNNNNSDDDDDDDDYDQNEMVGINTNDNMAR